MKVSSPAWAHVEGVGGYLFGPGTSLLAARTPRTGSWRVINPGGDTGGDTVERQRTYATLVVEHGVDPQDDAYAYTLLPGASEERTRELAAEAPPTGPRRALLGGAACCSHVCGGGRSPP